MTDHSISRRRFIGTALGAGLAIALPGCQQMGVQAARKRIVVDTQVHMWPAASAAVPWAPNLKPQLPEPFTGERYLPMMAEAGVDRATIVPPALTLFNNGYALSVAQRFPDKFAVMGRIPQSDPRGASQLATWKEQKGMLGLRLSYLGDEAARLTKGESDWIWPAAEKAGIPIMILAPELGAVMSRIAERHPQLTIIMDHMGMSVPVKMAGRTENAISQTVSLAKYPNVSVKLSATAAYSFEKYPWRDFNPHIRRLFDAYGPKRCHWGSDITNIWEGETYRQRVTHFTEEIDFISEEDKDWVMGRSVLERLKWA